jgi:[FeFe] hydrogenase H-cluster maturation GTPase HydF
MQKEKTTMSLNDTPSGERIHIGFFGRRNAGKSSVVNAVTGQELAVVSDQKGTTTDPVRKAMELLPMGPVVIIDTPGFDDEGALGEKRVQKTRQVLAATDVAVLVVDATVGLTSCEEELLRLFQERNVPYLIVWNKCDLLPTQPEAKPGEIYVSALRGEGIHALKEQIAHLGSKEEPMPGLVEGIVRPGDLVVLVIPIDESAPKGRLILPQQQAIRELLEVGASALCVKETELAALLEQLPPLRPALVITDSQAFRQVAAIVPPEVPLTSFSILMARHKGLLDAAVHGVAAISRLRDGDRVLIAEGCTHHRQCNDIGSVKLPRWLKQSTGRELTIELSSGRDFPEDLSRYALVIHCGGCMLNDREVRHRMKCAQGQGVPITNYGIAIASMMGILKRSVAIFPALAGELDA